MAKDIIVDQPGVKYSKPKILLVGVADSATNALLKAGWNVSSGTFGNPYRVPKADGYVPLIGESDLPNHTEQEIVIVELHFHNLESGPRGEKHKPSGEKDLWGKCDQGFIDPRPRGACQSSDAFDRTFQNGGAFVVFADAKTGIQLITARHTGGDYGRLQNEELFPFDVWDFLSELSGIAVTSDHGREMRVVDHSALGKLVSEHLHGGEFLCTFEPPHKQKDPWITLAENKFGGPVAISRCRGTEGSVIILPQIARKMEFLVKLFADVLPELCPHLFPDIAHGKWTQRPEYELSRVLEIKAEQQEIEHRAERNIEALHAELAKERVADGWLHDLLTGTDTSLVTAVKTALAEIGFSQVVDIDDERDRAGKSRREDLQIRDQSPTLVVDIKGIAGFPADEDALQADKHAAMRMREEKRTDIVGLSIINHQRHLPPLDRENALPFRKELIDAAEERSLGLMTTWDLYKVIRNSRKLGWRPEDVKPLFYSQGRVMPVPRHYSSIGTVQKAWTEKFGIVIAAGELRIGDKIAVEFPIEFKEVVVGSIQIDGKAAECAGIGDPVGLLWPSAHGKLQEGMRVFRIAV